MADQVRVEYSVGGVERSKREVEQFNAAVQGAKPASDDAAQATGDLGAGLGAVATGLSVVSPQAANWLVTLEGVRFLSDGAAAGTRNLGTALSGIVKFLTNPFVLGAAVVFAAIAQSISKWRREQEELNKRLETTRKRLEEQKQATDAIEGQNRADLESLIPDIERDVVRAGLPISQASDVATTAGRAAAISGLPVEQVTEVVRQIIRETRTVPDAQSLADIAGAIELAGDRQFESLRELIDSLPAVRPEVRRQAEERRAGLIGEIAERGAERQIDVVRSGTAQGAGIRDLIDQIEEAEQRVLTLEKQIQDLGGRSNERGFFQGLGDKIFQSDQRERESADALSDRIRSENLRLIELRDQLSRRESADRPAVQSGTARPGAIERGPSNPNLVPQADGVTINNYGTVNVDTGDPIRRAGSPRINRGESR